MFRKYSENMNQKGLTLIEVLGVIVIIGLIILFLVSRMNSAGDKTNELGVKTDYRTFQVASEQVLRETTGSKTDGSTIDEDLLNELLDLGMQFTGGDSAKKDPWGTEYTVEFAQATNVAASGTVNGDAVILIRSSGKDKTAGTTDDYLLATYYYQGVVSSCTKGYKGNSNVVADGITLAGECGTNAS